MTPSAIGCFTDVPVGYGTPQIQYLLRSLSTHFGNRCPVLVCEPHSAAYPDVHGEMPDFAFHSVRWKDAAGPFWFADGGRGQARLAEAFRDWLVARRPDVLVLAGFNALRYLDPASTFDRWRPFVVHYALEFLSRADMDPVTAAAHRDSARVVDLLLFSEANRQRHYNREFGTEAVPQALVFNAPPRRAFPAKPASRRNGRVLVQSASIQWDLTYPEYLVTTRRPQMPIDVYGLIYAGPARVLDAPDAAAAFGARYCGAVPNRQLAALRANYAYSFVAWAPRQFNTLYACPNKLFESIASGVPPIAAPHPQCAEVIGRYDCGILMRDWSFEAFCEALETARSILDTPRYRALVRNCLEAHDVELHWERQFEQVAPLLPRPDAQAKGAGRRRRVILVAPFLDTLTGRHWAEVSALASRARQAGVEPVLVAGCRLGAAPPGLRTHPVLPEADGMAATPMEPALDVALARERAGPTDRVVCWVDRARADRLASWLGHEPHRRGARWHLVPMDAAARSALSSWPGVAAPPGPSAQAARGRDGGVTLTPSIGSLAQALFP